jgi:hypothetical protein
MKYSKDSISFWKTQYSSYKTHVAGLTKEQIEFLKTLKEGDSLMLFVNEDKKSSYSPDMSLKLVIKSQE